MNSELIETFVAVANAGNITKSADLLFVSQATVSHRIKQLEEKLGVQLILRNKGSKQTNLTTAGKNFLPLAQSWLRLNDEISTFQERPQALELSIGVVDSVNNYLLADFYKELRQDALDWRLTVRTLHTQEIYDHVRQNTIDVGLPLGEQLIAGIQVKKIHTEKLMVVSRRKLKDKNTLFPIDLDTDYQIFIPWGQDYLHWHHRFFPPGEPPKFSVDSAKVAVELLDDRFWFLAPYDVCMQIAKTSPCHISKLGLDTPSRNLYMVTNNLTAQIKRKAVVMFKRRLTQYIRRRERSIEAMLNQYEPDAGIRSYKSFIHEFDANG